MSLILHWHLVFSLDFSFGFNFALVFLLSVDNKIFKLWSISLMRCVSRVHVSLAEDYDKPMLVETTYWY